MRPDAFTSTGQAASTGSPRVLGVHQTEAPRRLSLSDQVKLLDGRLAQCTASAAWYRLPTRTCSSDPTFVRAVLSSRIGGTKTDVSELLRFEAGQVLQVKRPTTPRRSELHRGDGARPPGA